MGKCCEEGSLLVEQVPLFLQLPQQPCFWVKCMLNQAGTQRRKRREEHKARQECAS